jgi:hypothetical protein
MERHAPAARLVCSQRIQAAASGTGTTNHAAPGADASSGAGKRSRARGHTDARTR